MNVVVEDSLRPQLLRRRSSSLGAAAVTGTDGNNNSTSPAFFITGCINEDGLGMVSWWD